MQYSTSFVLVRHRLELPNENKETQDIYSLYMHLASLSKSSDNAQPTAFDPSDKVGKINVPLSPIAVTAGDLLGYIGQFPAGENATADNAATLHLEVFADTSLEQFINAGRHYDTTLPAHQKPWLVVAHGAQTAKVLPSDTTVKHALHTGQGADGWALVQPCAKGIVPRSVLGKFGSNSYPNSNTVRKAVNRQSGVAESLLTSERAYWDGYYYDENWVRNTEATHFDASFSAPNATHRGILLPHGDPVWINAPLQEKNTPHGAENTEAWHFPFSTDALEEPEANENSILFVEDIKATLAEQQGDDVIHWHQVTYPTEDGEHTGWVCSQDQAHISLHSQWGWPGFEVANNTALTLDQYFARQMLAGNNVLEEEKSTFKAFAQAVEAGPIFERIYGIISKQMNTLLPPKDIPKTMRQPKVQQDLSRLIIKQPTEWQGSKPWTCLDQYMHDEAKPSWDATKEQIDKLAWWDEVNSKAKLNLGNTVMNVHPVALVGIHHKNSIKVTVEMLQRVFTAVNKNHPRYPFLEFMAENISLNADKYKLDTTLRLSHFFAQIREEASASCILQENLNYSVEGLKLFKNFRKEPNLAERYGYKKDKEGKIIQRANHKKIADIAYAGRIGNGDKDSGDGSKYIGRGLIQLTGRENYTQFNESYKKIWGGDVNFIDNPEFLSEVYLYAVRSAVYFWLINKLYKDADEGSSNTHVDKITRKINKYTQSYETRKNHFKRIYFDEKVFQSI